MGGPSRRDKYSAKMNGGRALLSLHVRRQRRARARPHRAAPPFVETHERARPGLGRGGSADRLTRSRVRVRLGGMPRRDPSNGKKKNTHTNRKRVGRELKSGARHRQIMEPPTHRVPLPCRRALTDVWVHRETGNHPGPPVRHRPVGQARARTSYKAVKPVRASHVLCTARGAHPEAVTPVLTRRCVFTRSRSSR